VSYPSPPFRNISEQNVSAAKLLFNYSYNNHHGNRDSSVRVVTWRQVGRPKNYSSNVAQARALPVLQSLQIVSGAHTVTYSAHIVVYSSTPKRNYTTLLHTL